MKKIFFLLLLVAVWQMTTAQNVGIGTTEPLNKLQVQGNLLVNAPTTTTNTVPAVAQTKTIVNASTISFATSDSTGRIYDPGGPSGNYNANITGNVSIASSATCVGIELTAETMQLGTGDSLIIKEFSSSATYLLAVGNGYSSTGKWVFNSSGLYIIFKSNADANVGSGFSLLFKRLYDNSTSLPEVSGITGKALFFDTKTGAFRSGDITNNIRGNYSGALGFGNSASGNYSTALGAVNDAAGSYSSALGLSNTASGNSSTAFGTDNNAAGAYSISGGYTTTASGNYAVALGRNTVASGTTSTAAGYLSVASGNNATALGYNNDAIGNGSTVTGYLNRAEADYSTSMGKYTKATGYASTTIGDSTLASGRISFASGFESIASGSYSTAMGYQTNASENYSTAIGAQTTASGDGSTAIGNQTTASGPYSTAMGNQTTASNFYSTAMGFSTTASGYYSTAMGALTTATGETSTAMGNQTTASGNYSTALGSFVSTNNNEGALIIGDHSTFTILNTTTPNSFRARFDGGYRFFTSAAAINSESCLLSPGSNAWSTASDFRLKEKFQQTNGEDFLVKISTMKLGSWNYISQNPLKQRHYGPMAQDFYAAFGSDKYGAIGNDTTINSADFDGVNLIAIQALEKRTQKIQQLETDNAKLQKEVDDLNMRLQKLEAVLQKR